ncbi:hypothetical protein K438DRAFT_1660350 [Mycena galopus ATCC 62051]|nr:hypothetical protein K438DRAFT_1660350 [Mycena galopus ATCC 62051]
MSALPPGSDSDPALLLPPDVARQLQVASLVFAGTTAVFIWDILQHVADNYQLLVKHKFRIATAAYIVSTITSVTYVLGFTLFSTYPIGNCQAALVVFNSFYPVSSGATSLLFFLRVRAIYDRQLLVTCIFGFLWLCVVGSAILIPFGTRAINVGTLCIVDSLSTYSPIAGIVLTVYDTSVFLAISYRLLLNIHTANSTGERVQVLFGRGASLEAFSNVLFRGGQTYYIIACISNIATTAMAYATRLNPIYRAMFLIPEVALTSIMACKVYRDTKLHYHRNTPVSIPLANDSSLGRFAVPLSPVGQSDPQKHRFSTTVGSAQRPTDKPASW